MLSHAAVLSARGVSCASAGIRPSSFWRLNVRSRSASRAVVELPFVLIGPFLEDVVRSVRGARRPVDEERRVWGEGPVAFHPCQGVLRHVFGEVVLLVVRRSIGLRFSTSLGSHCEVLAGKKTVEVVEADASPVGQA